MSAVGISGLKAGEDVNPVPAASSLRATLQARVTLDEALFLGASWLLVAATPYAMLVWIGGGVQLGLPLSRTVGLWAGVALALLYVPVLLSVYQPDAVVPAAAEPALTAPGVPPVTGLAPEGFMRLAPAHARAFRLSQAFGARGIGQSQAWNRANGGWVVVDAAGEVSQVMCADAAQWMAEAFGGRVEPAPAATP